MREARIGTAILLTLVDQSQPPFNTIKLISVIYKERKRHRMKTERTWAEILPTLTDTELRDEYNYLFSAGGKYLPYPLCRDLLIKNIIMINNEMQKRGI